MRTIGLIRHGTPHGRDDQWPRLRWCMADDEEPMRFSAPVVGWRGRLSSW
jgi:hypothetical protein